MSLLLALEQPLTVAYLGPEGTFTEAAAIKHFGHFARACHMASIAEVFREVESGAAHYGVVPVENSTEGVVNHTLDSFMGSPLKIAGEVELRIHHHLLVAPGVPREQVTRILSHQQSLAQCRAWLDAHWPTVERIPVASNAEAAALAQKTPGIAAIAGVMAGSATASPRWQKISRTTGQHHTFLSSDVSGSRRAGGTKQPARVDQESTRGAI